MTVVAASRDTVSTASKIELLYFDGCPTYKHALNDTEEIAKELGVSTDIKMIKVENDEDAMKLRFLGSPTIKINGEDIDSSALNSEDYGLRCRVYRVNGKLLGNPSEDMIRVALQRRVGS